MLMLINGNFLHIGILPNAYTYDTGPCKHLPRKSVSFWVTKLLRTLLYPQGGDPDRPPPPALPRSAGKAGRIHLNEINFPLLPTGRGERYSQTLSNLCQAELLRRCELLPISESAELTQWSLLQCSWIIDCDLLPSITYWSHFCVLRNAQALRHATPPL